MQSLTKSKNLLFSIDLEDVRSMIPDGFRFRENIVNNTEKILACTETPFTIFVVGELVDRYPDLIRSLHDRGYEIAYHTDQHIPLDKQTPETFAKDITTFQDRLVKLGIPPAIGFRAPTFSLTKQTKWAYKVLAQHGFVYSSSVLAVKHPLYGWPDYPGGVQCFEGILEIPMAISNYLMKIPFSGGVYLRLLPYRLVKQFMQKLAEPFITTYVHPYDVDVMQEYFIHPGLEGKTYLNPLMFIGRRSLNRKMQKMAKAFPVMRYDHFVQQYLKP